MPELTINGKSYTVAEGKRLVLAIEDNGVPIGHRCGGYAKCTTCRVEFESGEPDTMTVAEYQRLQQSDLMGTARLSCQIVCTHAMQVKPLMTAEDQPQWNGDTGPQPEDEVTPQAEWHSIEKLKTLE